LQSGQSSLIGCPRLKELTTAFMMLSLVKGVLCVCYASLHTTSRFFK
jgi:hypothetical protein